MNEDRMVNYGLFMAFLASLSLTIPLIVIGAPSLVISLVSLIMFLPFLIPSDWTGIVVIALYTLLLRPGLYIWGLVSAVNGQQDFVAIAFYIAAGLQAFGIVKNFVVYVCNLSLLIKGGRSEEEMPHLDIDPDAKVNWRD